MTIWNPDLNGFVGPRYRRMVEALAADIAAGRLRPGDKLPPQRDLAYRLKVTVGTVGRAYEEAARRGLVSGEVGRGTFVLARTLDRHAAPHESGAPINLAHTYPIPGEEVPLLAQTLRTLAGSSSLGQLLSYQPHAGRPRDRAAAAAWLRVSGIAADPDAIVITAGAQHAVATALSVATEPGDVLALEEMTYPGFKVAAQERRLRLQAIACDAEGLLPDALAAACAAGAIRALLLTPNLSNPLGGVLSAERRRAIVDVARRHDLVLIEDDVYGFLVERPPAFATLAPERTLFLTSFSKSIAAGLRTGYLLAPRHFSERLALAVRGSIWAAAPLLTEIATSWMLDGTAERLVAEKRAEASRRQALAREIVGVGAAGAEASYHFWLPLPDSWRALDFSAEANRRGVAVTPGSAFAVDRTPRLNGVRVSVSAPASAALVRQGLQIVADLAAQDPGRLLSVV